MSTENKLVSEINFHKTKFSQQSEPKGAGIGGEVFAFRFPDKCEWIFSQDSAQLAEKMDADRPDRVFVKYCELLRLGAYDRVVSELFVNDGKNYASLLEKYFKSEHRYFVGEVKGFCFNVVIRFDPYICLSVERLPKDDKEQSLTMNFLMKKVDGKYFFFNAPEKIDSNLTFFYSLASSFPFWQKPISYIDGGKECLQATYDESAQRVIFEFPAGDKSAMKEGSIRWYYDIELFNDGKNLSGTSQELFDFVSMVVADYQACDPFTLKGVEKIKRHWLDGEKYPQYKINTLGASANLWQNKIVTFDFYIKAGNNYFVMCRKKSTGSKVTTKRDFWTIAKTKDGLRLLQNTETVNYYVQRMLKSEQVVDQLYKRHVLLETQE